MSLLLYPKERPRLRPDPGKYQRVAVTPRDLAILTYLGQCQFVTSRQLQALFFGSYPRTAANLSQLFHTGLVAKYPPRRLGEPDVYCLTSKGLRVLSVEAGISAQDLEWESKAGLEGRSHEVEITGFRTALTLALARRYGFLTHYEYTVGRGRNKGARGQGHWIDLDQVAQVLFFTKSSAYWDKVEDPKNPGQSLAIRPDAFLALGGEDGSRRYFFYEHERRGKTKNLVRKLRGYRQYYFSGGFAAKWGNAGDKREDLPFRVLVTTPSLALRNFRCQEFALEAGKTSMVLFASFPEAIQALLGQVFLTAQEFLRVLEDRPEKAKQQLLKPSRSRERDRLVRDKARLQSLLDG